MTYQTPKQWAENMLSKPMGLGEDYGNLFMSLGATQDELKRRQGLDTSDTTTEDSNPTPSPNSRGLIQHSPASTSQAAISSGARGASKIKTACATCHARKIRCDLASTSKDGAPCTNCRRADRTDCRRHRRKPRAEARPLGESASEPNPDLQALIVTITGGPVAGGENESEGKRLRRLRKELRVLRESLLREGEAGEAVGEPS